MNISVIPLSYLLAPRYTFTALGALNTLTPVATLPVTSGVPGQAPLQKPNQALRIRTRAFATKVGGESGACEMVHTIRNPNAAGGGTPVVDGWGGINTKIRVDITAAADLTIGVIATDADLVGATGELEILSIEMIEI